MVYALPLRSVSVPTDTEALDNDEEDDSKYENFYTYNSNRRKKLREIARNQKKPINKPKAITDGEWLYLNNADPVCQEKHIPSMNFHGSGRRDTKRESYGYVITKLPSSLPGHPTMKGIPGVSFGSLSRDNLKGSGAKLPSTSDLPLGPGSHENNKSSIGTQIITHKRTAPRFTFGTDRKNPPMVKTAGASVNYLLPPQKVLVSKADPKYTMGQKIESKSRGGSEGVGFRSLPSYLGEGPSFVFTTAKNAEVTVSNALSGKFQKPEETLGFGFGCDLEEHLKYGQCLDGRCSNRKNFEKVTHKTRSRKPRGVRPQKATDGSAGSSNIHSRSMDITAPVSIPRRKTLEDEEEKIDPIVSVTQQVNDDKNVHIRDDLVEFIAPPPPKGFKSAQEAKGTSAVIMSPLVSDEEEAAEGPVGTKPAFNDPLCQTELLPVLPGIILAARDGDTKAIQYMLTIHKDPDTHIEIMPIDINLVDSFGNTALHYAAANNQVKVIGQLHKDAVKLYHNNRLHIDKVNKDGNSALHLAAMGGKAQACNALIAAGIDTTTVNYYGETALDICKGQETFNILRKCELISDLRRQIGAMSGYQAKEQPRPRTSRQKYNHQSFAPVIDERMYARTPVG